MIECSNNFWHKLNGWTSQAATKSLKQLLNIKKFACGAQKYFVLYNTFEIYINMKHNKKRKKDYTKVIRWVTNCKSCAPLSYDFHKLLNFDPEKMTFYIYIPQSKKEGSFYLFFWVIKTVLKNNFVFYFLII